MKKNSYKNYNILNIQKITSINGIASHLLHNRFGIEIVHLYCDDLENFFSITFTTIPLNSTGIAHILEHSVLSGSKKYPIKDTFNQLIKESLQTFINAFTYPDKTSYVVASQIKTDFFNLIKIYFDLIFNPLLTEETFAQEGYHLKISNTKNNNEYLKKQLNISGIVYNEMKGVYSSSESIIFNFIKKTLYPNSIYRFDSGGDPEKIPYLTYEQLKKFHKKFYIPSNAKIFIYGNINLKTHLEFFDKIFDQFKIKKNIKFFVKNQPKFLKPHYAVGHYPSIDKNSFVFHLSWMMMQNINYQEVIILKIIERALIQNTASPLKQALTLSEIGENLTSISGVEESFKNVAFIIGLRGCKKGKENKFESIILETFKNIVSTGLDLELIEGSINEIDFSSKEIIRLQFPYALTLMQRLLNPWMYGGNPFLGLNLSEIILEIREKLNKNRFLFENFIQKWFIENTHRVLTILKPQNNFLKKKEEKINKKIVIFKKKLNLFNKNFNFEQENNKNNFQKIIKIPTISLNEIVMHKKNLQIPAIELSKDGLDIYIHDIFTNGIIYFDCVIDISSLNEIEQLFLPLFANICINMGNQKLTALEIAKFKALKTGGINYFLIAGLTANGKNTWQKLVFRLKILQKHITEAIIFLKELLTEVNISDQKRLKNLIIESRNHLKSSIIPNGHLFAKRTATKWITIPAKREEQWYGRTQLRFQNTIVNNYNDYNESLEKGIFFMKKKIFQKKNIFLNITSSENDFNLILNEINIFKNCFPTFAQENNILNINYNNENYNYKTPSKEGICIDTHVSYIAEAYSAPPYKHRGCPYLMILCKILSNDFFYKKIRILGGAYGGMSTYDPFLGTLAFISYRDPHIMKTIKIYDSVIDFLSKTKISQNDFDCGIKNTINFFDKPMDPSTKGYISMIRKFIGLTNNDLEEMRSKILICNKDELIQYGIDFFSSSKKLNNVGIAIYSSDLKLKSLNTKLDNDLKFKIMSLIE